MRNLKVEEKKDPPGKLDPAQKKALRELCLFFGGVVLIAIIVLCMVAYYHHPSH